MIKMMAGGLLLILATACGTKEKKTTTAGRSAVADSLTAELNEVYKQGQFNGFSVAIVNENGILYQNGIGYADKAAQKFYTAQTIQNIASVSKTLVGVALLKAQELGKLQLDDSINKYLPFRVVNPFFPGTAITIRHLATHTSTILDGDFYLGKSYVLQPGQDTTKLQLYIDEEQVLNPPDSAIAMDEFLKAGLHTAGKWYTKENFLEQRPGIMFEYSNVATALAAYVLERTTGEKFDVFTKKYILDPLGMQASGWHFNEVDASSYSKLYHSPDTAVAYYSITTYPDGNFITSAGDLAKFLTELMKGYAGQGTLLNRDSYTTLFTQQLTAKNFTERNEQNPYNETYNYGIFMGFSVAGNIGHTGGDPGVTAILFFNPTTKIGRLLIVNTNINNKQGNDEFYAIWNKLEKYQGKL